MAFSCHLFVFLVLFSAATVMVAGDSVLIQEAENNWQMQNLGRSAVAKHDQKADRGTGWLVFCKTVEAAQQKVLPSRYFLTVLVMEKSSSGSNMSAFMAVVDVSKDPDAPPLLSFFVPYSYSGKMQCK